VTGGGGGGLTQWGAAAARHCTRVQVPGLSARAHPRLRQPRVLRHLAPRPLRRRRAGESQRLVIESSWSQITSKCQRF
jgi:hypothetical protein